MKSVPDDEPLPRYDNISWEHLAETKLHNQQKLQDRAISPIQSAAVDDAIPSATPNVKN